MFCGKAWRHVPLQQSNLLRVEGNNFVVVEEDVGSIFDSDFLAIQRGALPTGDG